MGVADLQRMLIGHGFPCGAAGADGLVGPDTSAAISRFQQAYDGPDGWLPITGQTDSQTETAIKWMQDNNALVTYFSVDELRCHGTNCCGGTCYVKRELLSAMFKVRQLVGPVVVVDAYRCAVHNAQVGGASNSQHPAGRAFDPVKGRINLTQAKQAGFEGIGLDGAGRIDHLDVRGGAVITFPDAGEG